MKLRQDTNGVSQASGEAAATGVTPIGRRMTNGGGRGGEQVGGRMVGGFVYRGRGNVGRRTVKRRDGLLCVTGFTRRESTCIGGERGKEKIETNRERQKEN